MAEDQKFTISSTLNGDTIYHIARNSSRQIIARELTLEKLQAAIKKYKEPPPEEPASVETTAGKEDETPVEAASAEDSGEPKKKFLTNKLSGAVQKRKGQSFWDKLK